MVPGDSPQWTRLVAAGDVSPARRAAREWLAERLSRRATACLGRTRASPAHRTCKAPRVRRR